MCFRTSCELSDAVITMTAFERSCVFVETLSYLVVSEAMCLNPAVS